MDLESVRELKGEIKRELRRFIRTQKRRPVRAQFFPSPLPEASPRRVCALGIAQGRKGNFKLAVRLQDLSGGIHWVLSHIKKRAGGEVDVKPIGRIVKQDIGPIPRTVKQGKGLTRRVRPLRPGCSIGHVSVGAGTLGAFVRVRGKMGDRILSNNHVLANENRAKKGDPILQPGKVDGGKSPQDTVGRLDRFVPLRQRAANKVDAALAVLGEGISYFAFSEALDMKWPPRGSEPPLGKRVFKLGRTTGLTQGRVTAFEVDGLTVEYDTGTFVFDGQIEIEPEGLSPFSLGGDSGAITVDEQGQVVGLVFAGNDADATYANPIEEVLARLNATLEI